MTLWDLLLAYLFTRMMGGSGVGPKWPGPGVPPQPTPPGPGVPPQPTPPTPTPPTPTPPTPTPPTPAQTTWKPYFYLQPDAGAKYGTPYSLAGEWHGDGAAWTDIYNYSKGRPLGQVSTPGTAYVDPGSGAFGSFGNAAARAKISGSPDYADVGDKLLIPWTWPEPSAPEIAARLQPIPSGTQLPGVPSGQSVSGDDDYRTV